MKILRDFWASFVFVFFFVFQQIYSFVWESENINSIYWISIYVALLAISCLQFKSGTNKKAISFVTVSIIGLLLTLVNGRPVGMVVLYIIYAVVGYGGLLFLTNKRINPNYLGLLLVFMYVVFYLVYFRFRELNVELADEGDLFGHSSSNTIALSLNFILWVYYFLDSEQGGKNILYIFFFSLVNLLLCFVQASRMGLAVALVMCLVVYLSLMKKSKSKVPRYLLYLVVLFILIKVPSYYSFFEDYIEASSIAGFDYGEEVRTREIRLFFSNMGFSQALLGYGDLSIFQNGRLFNGFLDYWNRYGLIPFIFLIALTIRRFVFRKDYSINIIVFIPLLLYSFAETIFGGTLWDFSLYLFLFYGYKRNDTHSALLEKYY